MPERKKGKKKGEKKQGKGKKKGRREKKEEKKRKEKEERKGEKSEHKLLPQRAAREQPSQIIHKKNVLVRSQHGGMTYPQFHC
jgi:hypothetical protein